MKAVKGYWYATERFSLYTHRAQFEVKKDGVCHLFDIYTTNSSEEEVVELIEKAVKKQHGESELRITKWSTKEQDHLTDKLIEEFLMSLSE